MIYNEILLRHGILKSGKKPEKKVLRDVRGKVDEQR